MLLEAYPYYKKPKKIDLKKNEVDLKKLNEILKWREIERIERKKEKKNKFQPAFTCSKLTIYVQS